MASPAILDFSLLLAPLPGDSPSGVDLRADLSFQSIYAAVRDARAKAREAERRDLFAEDGQASSSSADWRPVLELGCKAIAEHSKDLEIVALMIEALVRLHGFAGLRDGFRLARELVQTYWEHLYPAPDEEDGLATRLAPLTSLNGEDGDGLLIGPILKVPITGGRSVGPYSATDYQQAVEIERIQDPDKRARRLEQPGVVSKEQFDTGVRETPADFFRELRGDLTACSQEFEGLCAALEEKCRQEENGYSQAPPSSRIRATLKSLEELVESISRPVLGDDVRDAAASDRDLKPEAGPLAADLPATAVAGQVRTREEALQTLRRVAEFFRRTEPHSPLSYALEQAVRWARMPLPDLLNELIPDETSRLQLFKLMGIRTPEQQETVD